jgi:hypothetical protein
MRHARQITLVLQDRDTERPTELDIATIQELLAQEPLVSKAGAAGRLMIYSLDRRGVAPNETRFLSAANDRGQS